MNDRDIIKVGLRQLPDRALVRAKHECLTNPTKILMSGPTHKDGMY